MYMSLLIIVFTLSACTIKSACVDSDGNTCDLCLTQSNFETGTFRITNTGTYCLGEDIAFNPLPGSLASPNNFDSSSWFPANDETYPGSTVNTGGAYALGFFAAISIEASDVTLDLNGHTLSFHKHFYLQQRWGSIIEIANTPFLPGTGPADFGLELENVQNVVIKNGNLGLTSHHSIHANNATNVVMENLNIFDFEVGAIQFNGFKDITLKKLNIGPALQSVPLTAYYSGARFLALALRQIINEFAENNEPVPSVSFAYLDDGESLSLQQIYDNLIECMDIGFRDAIGESTGSDIANPMYADALNLFRNRDLLPDGSALYGIILNSFNVAINGFGHSPNIGGRHGEDVLIEDVIIDDLRLNANEVPALYFDACDGKDTKVSIKGPFGDIMDIRKMIDPGLVKLIDGYGHNDVDLSDLRYTGNPLSDGQIAFFLFKDKISLTSKSSFISGHFLKWALNDYGDDNSWPDCAAFVCNGDIMFHQNKGVIGLRMDGIENAEMNNVKISNLENRSPLSAYTCANYSGHHDGGHTSTPNAVDREGAMHSDVRGLSLYDGDVEVSGANSISGLSSFYGDVVGIDLMGDAVLDFDDDDAISVSDLNAASKVTQHEYDELVENKRSPFPNNFNLCNIEMDESSRVMDGPDHLQESDCELPTFLPSSDLPDTCDDVCDAFSVSVTDKQYNGDNICLTYDIERILDSGNACKKKLKYVQLGVCDADARLVKKSKDLTGLIESVTRSDGTNLRAWGSKSDLKGIRVKVHVADSEQFTICLKDVFNGHGAMSDAVKLRVGPKQNVGVCRADYVVGLPCLNPNKFESGAYANSGFNAVNQKYDVRDQDATSSNGNQAMLTGSRGTTNMVVMWGIIGVLIVLCLVIGILTRVKCKNHALKRQVSINAATNIQMNIKEVDLVDEVTVESNATADDNDNEHVDTL